MMEANTMALARLPPIDVIAKTREGSPKSGQRKQTGPYYTLPGSKDIKYSLPSPSALKPYQDTQAGILDTWPAHSTGQRGTTSVYLTKNKQLVVVDEEARGKVSTVPKPRFLEQLETFLKKELKAMGADAVEPSELRLQAHREVFEYLIEDFKTYKHLLSAIKNEYEMMVAHQKEVIHHMEPLRQMLVTVSEECDQKIMAIREEEKQEIADLKLENARLMKEISNLKNEKMLLNDTIEEMHKELADSHLRYCNIRDQHRQLIAENNDLRYQQEDILINKSNDDLQEEQDDPVTLRIALKKSREDESAATRRLHEMEANYSDVIPRRDYEDLQKLHNDLTEKFDALLKVKDEYDILLDDNKKLKQYGDEYFNKYKKLEESKTLGPNWSKVGEVIAGGPARWQQLSAGKNSDELLEVLLAEMNGSNPGSHAPLFFEGKGTAAEVPKHLQFEGPVRNLRLSKHHCLQTIRDIWRAKAAHDQQKEERTALSGYLPIYFQQHYPVGQMAVEWAYNLDDACIQYSKNPQIELFYNILHGQTEEEIYHYNKAEVDKLKDHIRSLDESKELQGEISKEDFKAALQACYPDFEEDVIISLLQNAEGVAEAKDLPTIRYAKLFIEDGNESDDMFTETIKSQIKKEKLKFLEEIKVHLKDNTNISVDLLRGAITEADKEINMTQLNHHVNWTFKTTTDDQAKAQTLPLNQVMHRLENCHILRTKKLS